MGRPPRTHYNGAVYHAMSRGNGAQTIFHQDADRIDFLEMLVQTKRRYGFKLYAYCLMGNHFHLLIRVGRHPLALIMQTLLTRYAMSFNSKLRRTGHLFQSRYKAILCETDSYLLQSIRYIHMNPVRAKLVQNPALWRWSGHSEFCSAPVNNGIVDTQFPLSVFDRDAAKARSLYRAFVSGKEETFLIPHSDIRIQKERIRPSADARPSLERLGELTAREALIDIGAIRGPSRIRAISGARHQFIIRALAEGHRPIEIGRFLGCSRAAVAKVYSRHPGVCPES